MNEKREQSLLMPHGPFSDCTYSEALQTVFIALNP